MPEMPPAIRAWVSASEVVARNCLEFSVGALAPPDAEVRREILRLQMDAELVKLTARAAALAAEKGIPFPAVPPGAPGRGGARARLAGLPRPQFHQAR